MCNEILVDMVDGKWVGVTRAIGGGGQVIGDYDPDNAEVVSAPQLLAAQKRDW
ncbi:MAG: hypothetical protein R3C46_01235 [Hyphomonadaceae bacterium]